MASWAEFQRQRPDMAAAGQELLFPDPVGNAFLGTVRRDGGPRMHPVCLILCEGELYVFVVNLGPKYRDLLRDPRYALHSFPTVAGGEEFYLTGLAHPEDDPQVRERVVRSANGALGTHDFEALFRFGLDNVLHTHWENWGTGVPSPQFAIWHAEKPPSAER